MSDNVHATEHPANPQPAPGQIWRLWCLARAWYILALVDYSDPSGSTGLITDVGGRMSLGTADLRATARCVGVETPHGRVMVGERRRSSASGILYTVMATIGGDRGLLRLDGGPGGRASTQEEAAFVAKWPLDTEPALRVVQTAGPSPEDAAAMRSLMNDWAARYAPSCVLPVEYDSVTIGGITLPAWTCPDAFTANLDPAALADKLDVPLTDPRVRRERRRREIDAVLREDARAYPAFATARRCAVMAAEEMHPASDGVPHGVLRECRTYEDRRGSGARLREKELYRLEVEKVTQDRRKVEEQFLNHRLSSAAPAATAAKVEQGVAQPMIAMTLYVMGIVGSVGLLALYHVSLGKELWAARRETSRFPLFEARTGLVMLIASGTMSEDDPAWRTMYEQVNFLLRMDQQFDLPHFIREYIKFRIEVGKNANLRAHVEETKQLELKAARRVPQFAAVRDDVSRGIMHMVDRRTRVWHWAVIYAGIGAVGALASAILAGERTLRTIVRALRHPSSDDFIGWQRMDRC